MIVFLLILFDLIYTEIPIIWMHVDIVDDMSILVASIASGDRYEIQHEHGGSLTN